MFIEDSLNGWAVLVSSGMNSGTRLQLSLCEGQVWFFLLQCESSADCNNWISQINRYAGGEFNPVSTQTKAPTIYIDTLERKQRLASWLYV